MIIVIKFFFPPRNFSSKIGINSMFQRLDRIVHVAEPYSGWIIKNKGTFWNC